jgi:hypothetical protein
MRFMVMHKNDKHTEAGEKPGPELIQKMGEFIGSYAQTGQFIDGAGLGASVRRSRLTFVGGQSTVKHGPYAGVHELISAVMMIKVGSRAEAIEWAERYGKILGDGEIEVGAVNEPWDLGLMPKPDDAPEQYLLLQKADRASESGEGLSPRQKADLTKLKNEMTRAGVLVSSMGLAPSSKAKRLTFTDHKLHMMDGPFSESKELIGGFAIMELPSVQAAVDMCVVYAGILGGTLEIDLRQVVEAERVAATDAAAT